MNPDGRWTAATPAAAQPQTYTAPDQTQYPGDSLYLPQPDYTGHPAMRPTLPNPDRGRLRMWAALVVVAVVVVAIGASLLIFHFATEKPTQNGHAASPSVSSSSKSANTRQQQGLKQVQTDLESYFTKTGHYPTNAQMSSAEWVKANMPSETASLQYAYKASDGTGTSCESSPNNCSFYALTTKLSGGSIYTLHSINS